MDIAIVSYQRFTDMPRDVYNACCQIGHTEASPWYRGHLRKLARRTRSNNTGRLDYRLRNALVMYAGDLIVGWAALYYVDGDTNPTASVWVKHAHRNKGYGTTLIEETYKRWSKHNPTVFRKVEALWRRLQFK